MDSILNTCLKEYTRQNISYVQYFQMSLHNADDEIV